MFHTEGVDAIATVTELRSDASGLVGRIQSSEDHILIQKNNEPHAVLIDPSTYAKLKQELDGADLSILTEDS